MRKRKKKEIKNFQFQIEIKRFQLSFHFIDTHFISTYRTRADRTAHVQSFDKQFKLK